MEADPIAKTFENECFILKSIYGELKEKQKENLC